MSLRSTGASSALHGRTHNHVASARPGNRALDEEQLALGVDAHDRQVLDRALRVAEMPRHPLARKHAARALALSGRSRRARRDRIAVRLAVRRKVMPLDHARKALAERDSLDVDLLPDLEDVDADFSADL